MECFNQKQKTIIHKFWIQGSAALIQSPHTHCSSGMIQHLREKDLDCFTSYRGERLGGICCMLSDEEMSFRLLLCWWERRWQWFEDQQLLECRGFVLVSLFYRWSRSADRKTKTTTTKKNKTLNTFFVHTDLDFYMEGLELFFFFVNLTWKPRLWRWGWRWSSTLRPSNMKAGFSMFL